MPGLTGDTIKIGFSLTTSVKSLSTGAKGASFADEKQQAMAFVNHMNETGGIAGRKIVAVFKVHGPGDTNTESGFQSDCEAFTQDSHVFAVYSTRALATSAIGNLASCLATRGTILVLDTNSAQSAQQLQKWAPYVYAPNLVGADRMKVYFDGLSAGGYFDADARVGVVSFDEPSAHREVDTFAAAAEAAGVKIADKQFMAPFTDTSGFSATASQVSNMVLKFKSEHIDHVVFVATYGTGGFVFPTQAEGQHYRPRYAFSTQDFPQVIALNAPRDQLRGAVGVGWDPMWDVDNAQDPGDNSAQTACLKILQDAGVASTDRAASRRAVGICDSLMFLKSSFDGVQGPSATSLLQRVSQADFAYVSAVTHLATFPNARLDGVAAVRRMAFGAHCSCWGYTSDWQNIP